MDIPTRCSSVVSESGTENFLNWFSAQFDKMEKPYTTNHKHLEDENFIEVLNDVQVKDILVTEGNATFLNLPPVEHNNVTWPVLIFQQNRIILCNFDAL